MKADDEAENRRCGSSRRVERENGFWSKKGKPTKSSGQLGTAEELLLVMKIVCPQIVKKQDYFFRLKILHGTHPRRSPNWYQPHCMICMTWYTTGNNYQRTIIQRQRDVFLADLIFSCNTSELRVHTTTYECTYVRSTSYDVPGGHFEYVKCII